MLNTVLNSIKQQKIKRGKGVFLLNYICYIVNTKDITSCNTLTLLHYRI